MSIESIDKSLKKLTEEIERSYNTFNIAINLTDDEGKKDKNIINHAFALKKTIDLIEVVFETYRMIISEQRDSVDKHIADLVSTKNMI